MPSGSNDSGPTAVAEPLCHGATDNDDDRDTVDASPSKSLTDSSTLLVSHACRALELDDAGPVLADEDDDAGDDDAPAGAGAGPESASSSLSSFPPYAGRRRSCDEISHEDTDAVTCGPDAAAAADASTDATGTADGDDANGDNAAAAAAAADNTSEGNAVAQQVAVGRTSFNPFRALFGGWRAKAGPNAAAAATAPGGNDDAAADTSANETTETAASADAGDGEAATAAPDGANEPDSGSGAQADGGAADGSNSADTADDATAPSSADAADNGAPGDGQQDDANDATKNDADATVGNNNAAAATAAATATATAAAAAKPRTPLSSWFARRIRGGGNEAATAAAAAAAAAATEDELPESEAQREAWASDILAGLTSGALEARIDGCKRLQASLKGPHAARYREVICQHSDLVPALLTLGRCRESAIQSVYTLQVMAASAADDCGLKERFDSFGATDELIASLSRSAESTGLEAAEHNRLLAHTLATLLNLCIGAVERKERCVGTPGFVLKLSELLYVEGPGAINVHNVCANLIASLAIGSNDRKEAFCTAGVLPHLAQLTAPDRPLELRLQAVVSLRAVMHSKHDRQLQAALQPGILDNLDDLLSLAPKNGARQAFKEVAIARELLLAARVRTGVDKDLTAEDGDSAEAAGGGSADRGNNDGATAADADAEQKQGDNVGEDDDDVFAAAGAESDAVVSSGKGAPAADDGKADDNAAAADDDDKVDDNAPESETDAGDSNEDVAAETGNNDDETAAAKSDAGEDQPVEAADESKDAVAEEERSEEGAAVADEARDEAADEAIEAAVNEEA